MTQPLTELSAAAMRAKVLREVASDLEKIAEVHRAHALDDVRDAVSHAETIEEAKQALAAGLRQSLLADGVGEAIALLRDRADKFREPRVRKQKNVADEVMAIGAADPDRQTYDPVAT